MSLLAVAMGYLLDLIVGDPHWMPHPVRLIGYGITKAEKLFRFICPKTKGGERLGGILTVFFVVLFSVLLPMGILWLSWKVHWGLYLGISTLMCYQLLATKSLRVESMAVYRELKVGNLPAAREKVSMIVGRDTASLNQAGVTKAAVETVAENTSDGVVAPLFYLALGGVPLGFLYKAVNTMDSMIGYQNQQYRYFGTAAAKLDDVLNFFPARFSALVMILAAFILRLDGKNAWRIFKRDRFHHKSPNSAQTEAVCAGALRVQLAGDAYYFGKLVKKETIGDPQREIVYTDIVLANRLLYLTSVMSAVVFLGIKAFLCYGIGGMMGWLL